MDAGTDTGTDAGFDAGMDGGFDAGTDGGFDAGTCVDKIDCGGAPCCTGHCAPADRGCCTGQDCLGTVFGNVCKGLACQCANEWDCSGPLRICDTAQAPPACIDGCTKAKCGPGKVCCDKNCYGGECCVHADCTVPGKSACKDSTHVCTDRCGAGLPPCGPAFVCCSDACHKGDCCGDPDCKSNPNGTLCVGYKCSRVCQTDLNCPGGKCCQAGTFKGTCYTGACCDDIQCGPPETCGGGGRPNECGCTSETREDFCRRNLKSCGEASGEDNCGITRTEECGVCQGCASVCDNGMCIPVSHAYSACDGGDIWWFDSCGSKEDMKKDCTPSQVCAGGACCTPEKDAEFCTRLGKNCLDVTALDNCSTQRTVNCGLCDKGWTCGLREPNVCGCNDDGTACTGRVCGTVTNNCGAPVGCGMCPMNDDCCDGKCVNLQTDRYNCLNCEKPCTWDEVCLSGCTPQKWELQGETVNPSNNALAHALGTNGTDPFVAWVGVDAVPDGGMARNSVWTHQYTGGIWKQLGSVLQGGLENVQPVVDLQIKSGTLHVVYAEGIGVLHIKLYDGNVWSEPFMGYTGPCSGLGSIALAPQDFSGTPTLTLMGAGGCGIGVGYAYWNANTMSWWETPIPPSPMRPGLITMNGAGNSDVVHDGNRGLVALADQGSIYVKYWDESVAPGSWKNVGGALNSSPIPTGGSPGSGLLSFALDAGKEKYVAFVQTISNVKSVFVKRFDSTAGSWMQIGPEKVSGPGNADSPSLTFIDGMPYVAFVEMHGTVGSVNVRRWNGQEWQRVGAALNVDPATSAVAPYLVGIEKTPYVAFRQNDAVSASRVYVVRFIPPP
jgi:hypothetical protein